MKRRLWLPAAALSLALIAGCQGKPGTGETRRRSRLALGTLVEITLVAPVAATETLFTAAFDEMERIDQLLGTHDQRGEIWRLNRDGYPDGSAVSPEVLGLLQRAKAIGAETGGALDCTVGSLMRLWDFEDGGSVPEEAEIRKTLGSVGWDLVSLDDRAGTVTFDNPGVVLDLGGIGKGYAVDRAYEVLTEGGGTGGIINAGGDLRVWGQRPGGGTWRIGIKHPRDPDGLLGVLELTDCSIVTSGDYEKSFTRDGVLYHHIIDPATGYPARGISSLTVVAPSAEEADGYATALTVMGPAAARSFLEGHPDLGLILVNDQGSVFVSPSLEKVFSPG